MKGQPSGWPFFSACTNGARYWCPTGASTMNCWRPVKLPTRSPNLNSFAERWVSSAKDECLSKLVVFGERSLRLALKEYVTPSSSRTEPPGQGKLTVVSRRRTDTSGRRPGSLSGTARWTAPALGQAELDARERRARPPETALVRAQNAIGSRRPEPQSSLRTPPSPPTPRRRPEPGSRTRRAHISSEGSHP